MKLEFLGTGAADWPLSRKSEFHRYLSSALIDGELLIDPGPCILSYESEHGGKVLNGVKSILVTHSHGDHFNQETLKNLAARHTVKLYAAEAVIAATEDTPGLEKHPIRPFEPFEVGKYRVTAVPGNHSTGNPSEQPVHYIIEDEKCLFYGLDGAWIINQSFHEMQKHTFDAMVFDCTAGDTPGEWRLFEHNTIPMLGYMVSTMRTAYPKMLPENCRVIASHFARTLHGTHEETSEKLSQYGIEAAYDGLVIEI